MKREDLLVEMKKCIGTQEPIVFFEKMVDAFTMLFDRIDQLETDLKSVKTFSALAIQWEPRVASDMLASQITRLRNDKDKDMYVTELTELKKAFAEDSVTQSYELFCSFWVKVLGWHPFLEYK